MFAAERYYREHINPPPVTLPERLGKTYVHDHAGLIEPKDHDAINEISNQLTLDHKIPLVIVTVTSLKEFNARDMRPILYATKLFNEWGIGYKDRNYGVLMFISEKDKAFKFSFGLDWPMEKIDEADRMWLEEINPRFNTGAVSGGILHGIERLDEIARSLELPPPSNPCYRGEDGLAQCKQVGNI